MENRNEQTQNRINCFAESWRSGNLDDNELVEYLLPIIRKWAMEYGNRFEIDVGDAIGEAILATYEALGYLRDDSGSILPYLKTSIANHLRSFKAEDEAFYVPRTTAATHKWSTHRHELDETNLAAGDRLKTFELLDFLEAYLDETEYALCLGILATGSMKEAMRELGFHQNNMSIITRLRRKLEEHEVDLWQIINI